MNAPAMSLTSRWYSQEPATFHPRVRGVIDANLIHLTSTDHQAAQFLDTLSSDEIARAERFHTEQLRHRFVVGRGSLRYILSGHLGIPPSRIRFAYSAFGKPMIAWPETDIHFNLAHSQDIGVCAINRNGEIGIDIEEERPLEGVADIATRFFSRAEAESLWSLPEPLRTKAFFKCWTRKEAYIKAVGEGLSMRLDSFEVTLLPDEPARLIHIEGEFKAAELWNLHHFEPLPGIITALAYSGPLQEVCWRTWAPPH